MRASTASRARPFLLPGALLSVALGIAAPTLAQPSSTSRAGAAEAAARTDVQWLQAIQAAAERVNYSGTIVYQRGGAMQSSRVVHYFDGAVSHERLQVLDGRRREYIRRGTEVRCLYPDTRRVRLERRLEQDRFPAIGAGTPAEILERYRLVVLGTERVADMECRVLMLEPKDDVRYGQWLCVEARTALLVKARTVDAQMNPLEQMAFAELKVGERIDRSQLRPSWSTDGWAVERVEPQPVDVERSGWQIAPPPGFRLQRAVLRSLAPGEAGEATMQVVYSDGLATLSVFIEANAGDTPTHDEVRRHGPTSGFARRVGDALVTVVGEVPPDTVRQVAQSVARAASSVPGR
jgi:sigma-E factor negative regulatory protein RseB